MSCSPDRWHIKIVAGVCLAFVGGWWTSLAAGQARPDSVSAGTLTVVVTGIEENRGAVAFALFDSEESYGTKENPLRSAYIEVQNRSCEWVVENLPFGDVGVMIYHDVNGNEKLDTRRLFRIPREPYGFSKDARSRFGPPSFDKMSFAFSSPTSTIEISLK